METGREVLMKISQTASLVMARLKYLSKDVFKSLPHLASLCSKASLQSYWGSCYCLDLQVFLLPKFARKYIWLQKLQFIGSLFSTCLSYISKVLSQSVFLSFLHYVFGHFLFYIFKLMLILGAMLIPSNWNPKLLKIIWKIVTKSSVMSVTFCI